MGNQSFMSCANLSAASTKNRDGSMTRTELL